MNDQQKLDFLVARLRQIAKAKHCWDGLDIEKGEYYDSTANGNFDDTFDDGEKYGRIELARDLLNELSND